ncbi:uncharacterized protein DUF1375 [Roseimicrobium gellanilyticum]|uniref:Uncharacterized protein DUF1375 n=1 Tax=Roseimicrobium gellanilyticum TaxID=748857 RepID=A0A366HW22_9BACT|nr:YceK/YidQ family lipoprotein [Roseimicrobium gellanilyticum]RBP47899.1 uncharacterized protein DUF1375 [Roseimicrobium gellanilyticum]
MSIEAFLPSPTLKCFALHVVTSACLVASLSSCATALVRQDNPTKVEHPYPATAFDIGFFWAAGIQGEPLMAMADPNARNSTGERLMYGAGSIVDLPVSVALDTVLLPFDTIQLLRMRKEKPEGNAE